MFRSSEDCFHLSDQTRADLEHAVASQYVEGSTDEHPGRFCPSSATKEKLLKAAKSYKAQTDWSSFEPSEPTLAVKHIYDVSEDKWVEEKVMVEIDSKPFGHGALRECFRMREVPMKKNSEGALVRQISDDVDQSPCGGDTPGGGSGTPAGSPLHELMTSLTQIASKTKRRCWVAKRSTTGHGDREQHKQDCLADAALQQVAKHHAEAFNSSRRSIGNVPKHVQMHEVDFLMSHVIELPCGSTFGVEAFVFGHYEKYNNNSGGVMRPLDMVTPQAFSYFTFVHSGFRQMVVDIQGVDDIYTDPVLHFLPEHNQTLAALGDQSVNLGVRGFALFLWSHRCNPIDTLLGLPSFPHAVSEQRAVGGVAGLTVAHLAATSQEKVFKPPARAVSAPQPGHKVRLAGVPGVNLQPQAWSSVRVHAEAETDGGPALPLDLVWAACHMELAIMYNEGRIGEGNEKQSENEAAVFHMVLAAQQGLPEAMLALARICSGLSHDDMLPEVQCDPEHGALCLLLLERVAEASSSKSALAARGALANLLASGALGDAHSAAAARHFEAFAQAVAAGAAGESDKKQPTAGLEVTSRYGCTFGWEDHGLEAHSAYAKAAEVHAAKQDKESKAHAKRLWEAASECAMEDPRLAKQAMRYMEYAEAADCEESEVDGSPDSGDTNKDGDELCITGVPPAVREEFERFVAELGATQAAGLQELLRRAREPASAAATETTEADGAEPSKPPAPVEDIDEDVWAMLG